MGSAQHVVDMTIVYVAMLALELTYVHARYRVMVVVLGSLGGVAWALIMVRRNLRNLATCLSLFIYS